MADFRDQLWNYIDSVLPRASPELKQKLLQQVGQAAQRPSQSPVVAGVLGMTGSGLKAPEALLNPEATAGPVSVLNTSARPNFTMGEGGPATGPYKPNFKMLPGEQPGQAVVPKATVAPVVQPIDLPQGPYGAVPTDPAKVGSWWQGLSPKQKIGVLTALGAGGVVGAKAISDKGAAPTSEASSPAAPATAGTSGAAGSSGAETEKAAAPSEAPVSKNPIPEDHNAPATQTFSQAFAAARKAGRPIFEWNGKHYNTKVAHHAIRARESKAVRSPEAGRHSDLRGPMPGDNSADMLNERELERLHGQAR